MNSKSSPCYVRGSPKRINRLTCCKNSKEFIFNDFVNLESAKYIWALTTVRAKDLLDVIYLRLGKTVMQGVTVVKFGIDGEGRDGTLDVFSRPTY